MFPLKLRGGLPWIKGQKEVTLWEGLSPPVPEFTGCLNHPDKTQKRDHSYPKVTTYQYRKAVDLSGRGIIVVFSKYRSIASCLYATKTKSRCEVKRNCETLDTWDHNVWSFSNVWCFLFCHNYKQDHHLCEVHQIKKSLVVGQVGRVEAFRGCCRPPCKGWGRRSCTIYSAADATSAATLLQIRPLLQISPLQLQAFQWKSCKTVYRWSVAD